MDGHDGLSVILILVYALGIGAQWLAWALRLPSIVILTVVGLAVGPVFGFIVPSEQFASLLRPVVGMAVALILFEGGLSLRLHEFREAATGLKRLVSAGLLLSWLFGTVAAHFIGGLSWPVSVLLGAILVVTGPTVIVPMLRQAKLARRPASFLKWEGIINDPLGAILAVLVFEFFALSGIGIDTLQEQGLLPLTGPLLKLGSALVVAAMLGIVAGIALGPAFRREWVPDFLKAPVVLAVALVVFGLSNLVLPESGLLATTVFGVMIGNARHVRGMAAVRNFNESLTVILVGGVFILLTASLELDLLLDLDWRSAAFLATMLFVVRPAAVWLATIKADMTWRERLLVGWIAPRGIVAAAVAGYVSPTMVEKGFAGAESLMPLIFAVILLTVVLHGFSLRWLARRLDLAAASREGVLIVGVSGWSVKLAQELKSVGIPVLVADTNEYLLQKPSSRGIPVHHGEILSGASEEELDLYEIGYVLAATGSDAYNALVCTHFANELGHERVFQLAMHEVDVGDREAPSPEARGRIAIEDWAYQDELERRCRIGWRLVATTLDQFASALNDARQGAALVVLLRDNGTLVFNTTRSTPEPEPGDTVIAFIPPFEDGGTPKADDGSFH